MLNEAHLKRIVFTFLEYYHRARPHRALDQNAPEPRAVEPPERGAVVAEPGSVACIIATAVAPESPLDVQGKSAPETYDHDAPRRLQFYHTPVFGPIKLCVD